MKYLDLSGLEHLIGRLIQWRSTDWTLNVNGATPTVVSPSVADNAEFWSKIAAGDSVTLTFSNGDPTRKAFVISVDRDRNTAIFVAGTSVKLTQYVLRSQGGSMVLKGLDIPNASDVNSKLTASGTTEDLTVDTDGNLGLSYGDGFIERLCSDLGNTLQGKFNLGANSGLGTALAVNNTFISVLASNNNFSTKLAASSSFIEHLATGELPKNNYFGTSLALYNSAFATALPQNSAFATALATSSQFCSALANHSFFGYTLAGAQSFYNSLAAKSGFRDSLITNLSTAQATALRNKLGV